MDFILEKAGEKYDYGCVMLYLNIDTSELHEQILEKDLTGIEDEPHVTLLYGLHSEVDSSDIRDVLKGIKFGDVSLSNISMFESDEHDVLKYDIEGNGIIEANKALATLPHTSKFKEYNAHLTIAYVKSGKGKKYIDKLGKDNKKIKPLFVVYSPGGDGDKIVINIDK